MEDSGRFLAKYRQYLRLERGFSPHTVDAYLRDVDKLMAYMSAEHLTLSGVTIDHLDNFSAGLRDIGIHPRSQARILSGVRSFFHFLVMAGYLASDPSELLPSPDIGVHLPEVLTLEEIDALIAAIDLSLPEGHRNRAMLEVLYSCGVRVSELCNLKLSELHFEEGFILVEGKGSKQRLVPISSRAIQELELYLIDRRIVRVRPGYEDYVFLSRFGKNISRIMVFHIIKELAHYIGLQKEISPHTFRHSFATHLLEGGANLRAIQMMLGHEHINTTEIYTHIDCNMLRSEIIEHHPRNMRRGGSSR